MEMKRELIKIKDKNNKILQAGDILQSENGNKYIFLSCGFISPEIDNDFHKFDEFFYKFISSNNTLFFYDAKIIGKVSVEELIYLVTLVFYRFPKIVIYYNRYLEPKSKEINEIKNNEFFSHYKVK